MGLSNWLRRGAKLTRATNKIESTISRSRLIRLGNSPKLYRRGAHSPMPTAGANSRLGSFSSSLKREAYYSPTLNKAKEMASGAGTAIRGHLGRNRMRYVAGAATTGAGYLGVKAYQNRPLQKSYSNSSLADRMLYSRMRR